MRESAELAKRLIQESCTKQCILPGQLSLHANRGTLMSSPPVAFLLADSGVTKTRPIAVLTFPMTTRTRRVSSAP